jgi:hypothetical protein
MARIGIRPRRLEVEYGRILVKLEGLKKLRFARIDAATVLINVLPQLE